MALRAFQSNPSLGGFGSESHLPLSSAQHGDGTASLATSHGATINKMLSGSCGDAFAQIVKELVDNAVDACTPFNSHVKSNKQHDDSETSTSKSLEHTRINHVYKRVRVKIESTEFQPIKEISDGKMDCLRITVSDNGVGMHDIDACVMVFSSNKNNMSTKQSRTHQSSSKSAVKKSANNNAISSNKIKSKIKKNDKSSSSNKSTANDGYTSGRYGIGLTLCLLHAQRLVPGSVTCITSATVTSKQWIRCTYQVDMDADVVRCKRREEIDKEDVNDCGTIVSLLVPGGDGARNAWPRLAEYFARFQLSLDLSCSLEVLAPSLSRRPLMIRPPSEMERRGRMANEVHHETKNSCNDEQREINLDWDGNDGFVDNDDENTTENSNLQLLPNRTSDKISKAAKERERIQQEKHRRIALICKAAELYKDRPVSVKNVAFETHPIRRLNASGGQSNREKNTSFLDVGIFVFGPEPDDVNSDGGSVHGDYPQRCHHDSNQHKTDRSATLQLVRMVNGIPLLDSPEALACGIVQKVSNNGANWNSFGLEVSSKKMDESVTKRLGGDNGTPMFNVEDSAQVAPFFRESAHGLFHGKHRQDDNDDDSSSEEDSFDPGHCTRKRKKTRSSLTTLFPAALRLGEMLMIVNIRAKPSALPLPTLSKGRLPLNDKGLNNALENGITSCLRSLQRTNPKLLLTAHQLKRVERDLKYVPSVASAIASVLGRSKQRGLFAHVASVMAGWDEEVKQLGIPPFDEEIEADQRIKRKNAHEATDPRVLANEIESCRVEALRPILERRLKFIVSEEFKDAKKENETAKRKEEKARQARKRRQSAEAEGMNSDCFGSDDSRKCRSLCHHAEVVKPSHSDFESETSSPEIACRQRAKQSEVGMHLDQSDASDKASYEAGLSKPRLTNMTARSPANFSSNDGFDSDENSMTALSNAAGVRKPNDISSDDDWSAEYGMVVPGSFFR